MILSLAIAAAITLPAAAHAAGTTVTGVVVAKDAKRGMLVVATRAGAARTVQARLSAARFGDRIRVAGTKVTDGTVRAGTLRAIGYARKTTVQGVVVRRSSSRTLVATGGSVIAIGRSVTKRAFAQAGLQPGSIARFGLAIKGGGVRETSAKALGTATTVEVEGQVVTVSPLVVNVKGLPIPIVVPDPTLLPAMLAIGDEVELSVTVDANSVFTLVSVDSTQARQQGGSSGDQPGADDGQSADQQNADDRDPDDQGSASQGSDDRKEGRDDGSSGGQSSGGQGHGSSSGGDSGGGGGGDD
jgi:uncharacterized membrane protein YgcG